MRAVFGLMGVSALLLAGCASVGPPTIARDRFDYVNTISDSWKRQTLLKLIKVRCADLPVFMDVSSEICSYPLEVGISLGASTRRSDAAKPTAMSAPPAATRARRPFAASRSPVRSSPRA